MMVRSSREHRLSSFVETIVRNTLPFIPVGFVLPKVHRGQLLDDVIDYLSGSRIDGGINECPGGRFIRIDGHLKALHEPVIILTAHSGMKVATESCWLNAAKDRDTEVFNKECPASDMVCCLRADPIPGFKIERAVRLMLFPVPCGEQAN